MTKYQCGICGEYIEETDTQFYTDNGNRIEGNFKICEFCYLNLQKMLSEED